MLEIQLKSIAALVIACSQNRLPTKKKTPPDKEDSNFSRTEQIIKGMSPEENYLFKANFKKIAEKEISLASEMGIEIIFRNQENYPPMLKNIYDPPDFIYASGNSKLLKKRSLAIVGARRHSPYSYQVLTSIIPEITAMGLNIVSGMAYGVDSIVHKKTLEASGFTTGVNAGGLLNIYPSGNRKLTSDIASRGCIISELPMEVCPRPYHFPLRNRIISGISEGTLVVEAETKSGSLITASLALDQNREVMAVPGPITSPLSCGTNQLIKGGATPVTSGQDIAETLGIILKKQENYCPQLNSKEKKLLDLMVGNKVISIDYMVEHLDLTVSEIISTAMDMVLKNAITEEPGGYRKII